MKILKWLLGTIALALALQYLLAMFLPRLIMEVLHDRGGTQMGYNRLVVGPIPDESSRTVVRPSPDLLYGSCIYNLDTGPLLIEAQVPHRYWSMQFYQMNTDNFAGITNQRDERHRIGKLVKVTLIGPQDDPANYQGTVFQSPTVRGMVLLRASAIGDISGQRAALEGSSCGPA